MNIPEGYKLVPVEPTNEMKKAIYGLLSAYDDGSDISPSFFMKMLINSAPTPPQPIYDEARESALLELSEIKESLEYRGSLLCRVQDERDAAIWHLKALVSDGAHYDAAADFIDGVYSEVSDPRKTSAELYVRLKSIERALAGMLFAFDDGVGREWSEDLLDFARKLTPAVEFQSRAKSVEVGDE